MWRKRRREGDHMGHVKVNLVKEKWDEEWAPQAPATPLSPDVPCAALDLRWFSEYQ